MNRREKRKIKKEIEIFSDVAKIIKQYFPDLSKKLNELTDTRHQSYVEYQMSVITITRLLGLLCGIKSMRETTEKLDTEETIKNIGNILGIELEEIPHYDTINNVFEQIEIEELRKIQKYMVNRLIRSKMFDKYRFKGKYFQIVIDGTSMMKFKKRHCKHCLKRVHNEGKENEYSIYYHYVLEAKLVVGEIVISLDSEFVENEDENVEKQDCEIKAFYRMAKRIKKEYPKLPIVITGDALYACEPVIKRCKENKWEYIIRLKKDRLKALRRRNRRIGTVRGKKYYEEGKEYMWIVSFKITERNSKELIYFGRQRWRIENEGFNMQKNGTFDIEHVYSQNYNAIKAHYLFIQFAHTIRQLLEKGIKYIKELKISKKEVSALLIEALTQTKINLTENNKIQLRFVLKLSI